MVYNNVSISTNKTNVGAITSLQQHGKPSDNLNRMTAL
jgi:hypothetical protein